MGPDLSHIKGLLFDKDGTLIDFSASWLQPMKDVTGLIARHDGRAELQMQLLLDGGYLPDTDSWAKDSSIAFETSEVIFNRWASLSSPELIESLMPEIQAMILASLENAVPVIDDMRALFSQLGTHYALGVASMDDIANVQQTLKSLDINEYLSFCCGADSGFGHKPGPGMVHAFCEHTRLPASSVAVIGDATHDLKMARAAGAIAVGVLGGASTKNALSKHADMLIADIGELPEYF